jgi:hypothetical protein
VNRLLYASRLDVDASGGRPPRQGSREDLRRSGDMRRCAQWFARFGFNTGDVRGRPSRSETRRLREETEALHRLCEWRAIPYVVTKGRKGLRWVRMIWVPRNGDQP